MPIRVRLDRLLLERRMSLTELADRVGVTIANLSILKTGKARAIRFSTLAALCRELDCQPGGDLVWPSSPARRTIRTRRGSRRTRRVARMISSSLPFMGRDRRRSRQGGARAAPRASGIAKARPTRLALRAIHPPHEGEGGNKTPMPALG